MFLWEKQQKSWMRTWGGKDTKHPEHRCRGACSTKAGSSSWVWGRCGDGDPGGLPLPQNRLYWKAGVGLLGRWRQQRAGALLSAALGRGSLSALTNSTNRLTKAGREACEQRTTSNLTHLKLVFTKLQPTSDLSRTDSNCSERAVWVFPHMLIYI